jgi:hypothetical protein
MRTSEAIGMVGLAIGATLVFTQRGALFSVGSLVLVGTFIWYAVWGCRMRGWVGASEQELLANLAAVEKGLQELEAQPDTPEKRKEWLRLDNAKVNIWHQLHARARAMKK